MRTIFLFILFISCTLWAEIKAVIFDYGGVVGNIDREKVLDFISTSLDVSHEEALRLARGWKKVMNSGGDEFYYWENAQGICQKWFDDFSEVVLEAMYQNQGVIAIVKELQSQGYRTPLFSNVTIGEAEWLKRKDDYEHFSPLFLSYEMDLAKPDPRSYEYVLNHLQLKPQEVIFIDDKKENVDAAVALGIYGIQFKNEALLAQELEKCLAQK